MGVILEFPQKIFSVTPRQLDLFEHSERYIGKFNFLDINKSDERELTDALQRFNFTAVVDLRKFPTFDRPRYDHRRFLDFLNSSGVLYIPFVYMMKFEPSHKELQPLRRSFTKAVSSGPILLFYNDANTSKEDLRMWANELSRRFDSLSEAHPRTFGFLRSTP